MIDLKKFKRLKFSDTKVKSEVGDALTWQTMDDNYTGMVIAISTRNCIVEFPSGQYKLPRNWGGFGHVVKGFNHFHLFKATV